MHLFKLALFDMSAAAKPRPGRRRPGGSVEAREVFFRLGDHGRMVNRTGGGDHDIRTTIMPGEVVAQFPAVERAHRLRRAEYRAAERLIGKRDGLQMLENKIVGRVGDRANLLHDDILLKRKFVAGEGRLGQNVSQHVERQRHIGFEHARVIGGALGAGRRVEIAADGLDFLSDLPSGPPPCAFERHMFEKMRDAVLVVAFAAAAGIDPHAQ